MDIILDYLPPPWVVWIITGTAAFLLVILAAVIYRALHRAIRHAWKAHRAKERQPTKPDVIEDWITRAAAGIATGVSAQGMWRFAGDVLGLDGPLRVLLFAFIELAIIVSAIRAQRSMRENYSAGLDGIAVWALACLTAVLSSLDARSFGEAVFRLVAPLVAAWLWERGMRLERHRIRGTKGINWRVTPERILVRIGLAEAQDRTASEVDTQRRLTRVALAADKVAETQPGTRAHRQRVAALKRQGRRMVTHTAVATNKEQQEMLMAQLGVARSIAELADAAPPPFWATPKTSDPTPEGQAALDELQAWDGDAATERARRRAELAMLTTAPDAAGHQRTVMDGRGHDRKAIATSTGHDRPARPVTEMTTTTPTLDAATDRPTLTRSISPATDVSTTGPRPDGNDQTPNATGRDRTEVDATTTPTIPPPLQLPTRTRLLPFRVRRDQVATTLRPAADQQKDHDKTDATKPKKTRDKVIAHVVATIEATGQAPTKNDLATWSGWSGTWCLERIHEVTAQLADGWTLDADGKWTRPGDPEATGRINGSAVVAS